MLSSVRPSSAGSFIRRGFGFHDAKAVIALASSASAASAHLSPEGMNSPTERAGAPVFDGMSSHT